MSVFDIMNYPFLITHISVTDGYNQDYHHTHPSSGVWVPSVAVRTAITGATCPLIAVRTATDGTHTPDDG